MQRIIFIVFIFLTFLLEAQENNNFKVPMWLKIQSCPNFGFHSPDTNTCDEIIIHDNLIYNTMLEYLPNHKSVEVKDMKEYFTININIKFEQISDTIKLVNLKYFSYNSKTYLLNDTLKELFLEYIPYDHRLLIEYRNY